MKLHSHSYTLIEYPNMALYIVYTSHVTAPLIYLLNILGLETYNRTHNAMMQ